MPPNLRLTRRTALKTIGAGVASAALVGTASAGETAAGNHHSYTWAHDTLYDMLESEPPGGGDSEGAEPAHRPIWIIKSMAGTGVPGSEHSPHPAPIPGIDHVIDLDPGKRFYSAQWHVHFVTDEPFDFTNFASNVTNLINSYDGEYLTSADAIRTAAQDPNVYVTELPEVFTCPVRPHNHHPHRG